MNYRYFYVKITAGSSQGPYNVYYDGVSTNYATLVSTESNAINVSYTDLITGLGVLVSVPSSSTLITLYNTKENCSFEFSSSLPTPTPTNTPTNTTTPTVTPTETNTPTPTQTPTQSETPTQTPTPTNTPTPTIDTSFHGILTPFYPVTNKGCASCGSNIINEYESLDFHTQTDCLDLSSATDGDVITFSYSALDRPNRFLIKDNGVTVAVTDWIGNPAGYDIGDYYYPTFNATGVKTFTYHSGHTYEVMVDIAPASLIYPMSDSYTYSISCPHTTVLTGTTQCLAAMEFLVRYSDTRGSKPGGHQCDRGTFNLKANNVVVGTVYLSNTNGPNDHHNYWPGENGGMDRYNSLTLTNQQVQDIATSSVNGVIQLSLNCLLPGGCHESVNWVTVKVNGTQIYDGYPVGNFVKINACTGQIVP